MLSIQRPIKLEKKNTATDFIWALYNKPTEHKLWKGKGWGGIEILQHQKKKVTENSADQSNY